MLFLTWKLSHNLRQGSLLLPVMLPTDGSEFAANHPQRAPAHFQNRCWHSVHVCTSTARHLSHLTPITHFNCLNTHTYRRKHKQAHTQTQRHAGHACTQAQGYVHMHTTHTNTHTLTRAHTQTHTLTRAHTRTTHTHTYTHTNTCTHTHTHTH